MKKTQTILMVTVLLIFSIYLNLGVQSACSLEQQIDSPAPSTKEERSLTSSEISSIIHEKVQREQATQQSYYNPASISIAILIVGVVTYFVIKWDKKN